MKLPRLRWLLLTPLALFALFYSAVALKTALDDYAIAPLADAPAAAREVIIFGASGTAGDGILKAALADPAIETVHVITRRTTPRIDAGVAAGKVEVVIHRDYLDYAAVEDRFVNADAAYWAIGMSSVNADPDVYARVTVDFPVRFAERWLAVSARPAISFHYISSSDISEESTMMYAREKIRAEKALFALSAGTKLRTVAYRPDFIRPTREQLTLRDRLLYGFFAPVASALRATQIGEAMLEVSARQEIGNGEKLPTREIIALAEAYEARID